MAEDRVDIRDLRDGGFLWLDKSALEFISRKTGNTAVVVYSWLCYYANAKAQNCFPSITTLANHCQISRRTVMRIIIQLERIKVVTIERQHGKPNVYKLLDVKRTPAKTSDMDVTSDTGGTGVGAVVSPPLVTPQTLEQELNKQELINKSASCLFDFWKDVKLPYAMPTTQVIGELDALCQQLIEEVNLYRFILDFRTERGYPPPPDALINACRKYERYKDRVDNPWGWFHTMIDVKSGEYFANEEVKQHEKLKKEPPTVGKILAQMAKDV
ncbi:MAG: helix-turn-helix domain-containing protein [Candidatus Omnitrophota bacterium]